jgi:hypothetical protein
VLEGARELIAFSAVSEPYVHNSMSTLLKDKISVFMQQVIVLAKLRCFV